MRDYNSLPSATERSVKFLTDGSGGSADSGGGKLRRQRELDRLAPIILHVAAKLTRAGIHAPVTRHDPDADMIIVGNRCPAYRGKSNWADDHILGVKGRGNWKTRISFVWVRIIPAALSLGVRQKHISRNAQACGETDVLTQMTAAILLLQ